jgi:hypothetical protein
MDRAFVIKGPADKKGVLFAEKSPTKKELSGMNFLTNQIRVEQVNLVDGHPLKYKHQVPTLYVFAKPNGQQEVFVGTQTSGKWNLAPCNKRFVEQVGLVETILKSRTSK